MGTARRKLGDPSPVSDLRGGPAAIRGLVYQEQVTLTELLELCGLLRREPDYEPLFLVEPRVIMSTGQYGFDFGTSANDSPYLAEVKVNPNLGDVQEFVARLPAVLGRSEASCEAVLICGKEGKAVRTLDVLARLAREGGDEEGFIRVISGRGLGPAAAELLTLAGGPTAWSFLRRVRVRVEPVSVTETRWRVLVNVLSAADKQGDLMDTLSRSIKEAAENREALSVRELVNRLLRRRLIRAAAGVNISAGPAAHAGVVPITIPIEGRGPTSHGHRRFLLQFKNLTGGPVFQISHEYEDEHHEPLRFFATSTQRRVITMLSDGETSSGFDLIVHATDELSPNCRVHWLNADGEPAWFLGAVNTDY